MPNARQDTGKVGDNMSGIQTGIELNDQFTNVIYGIINAVNLAVSSMSDLSQGMSAPVDTSSLDGARNEINAVTAAMMELDEAMQKQTNTDIVPPMVGGGNQEPISVPVEPKLPEPLIENPPSIEIPVQPNAPPDPVEIPIQWETDGLDVFTNTGIERFQQEVQSANAMLDQLSTTQNEIARQSSNISILSPKASEDLHSMAVRIDILRNSIQQIENNPVNIGTDKVNAELEQLRSQLNQALQAQNNLNGAIQNMDVSAANAAYLRLSQTVSSTEQYIRDNTGAQGQFNQTVQQGVGPANNLVQSIRNMVGAYLGIQTVKGIGALSDTITLTNARLGQMNDGLQSTAELNNMIYAAAQNARGSLTGMASIVARFGNNAKDAFSSTKEVVAFSSLVQKQMTIAGASTQEAGNAMLQLSQALGSGVLRGDELNSIFEQAPNLIQNIADYMGKPIGKIREMAADGEITADIVKNAIFAASDDINAKFEEMPMTWGQTWQYFQNGATKAMEPVLQYINDIANDPAFKEFVNDAIDAMAILSSALLMVFALVESVGNFFSDNWSIIAPIILGIAAAFTVYTLATKGVTLAVNAWSAAQKFLNAVLSLNPVVLVIIAIIALIAIIFAVCNAIAKFTGITQSGFGVIMGAVAVVGAFLYNTFIGVINAIIQFMWSYFVEPFIGIIEWVLNVANGGFNSFGDAVANLIGNIISWFLSLGKVVTKIIDAIFGTDWTSGLSSLQNEVIGWGKNENAITLDRTAPMIDSRIEYSTAWDVGSAWGDGIADKVSSFSLADIFGKTEMPNIDDYLNSLNDSGMPSNMQSTADNTKAIKDSIELTEEDLKYLRDIAEREVINRYTTAEITIDQSGMQNNISSNMDIDGFVSGLTDSVNEVIDSITEGVHP